MQPLSLLLTLSAVASLDILFELVYQFYFAQDVLDTLTAYRGLDSAVEDFDTSKFIHDASHSAYSTINHLLLHLAILLTSMLILSHATQKRPPPVTPTDGKVYFMRGFMGLSSSEMILLYVQYATILGCELHAPLGALFGHSVLKWPVLLLLLLFVAAPLVARARVFVEKRFHNKAPIAYALLLTAAVFLYNSLFFVDHRFVLRSLGTLPDTGAAFLKFCSGNSLFFTVYNNPASHFNNCTDTFYCTVPPTIVIYGDLSKTDPDQIAAALIAEAYKSTLAGFLGFTVLPLLSRLAAAYFLILFNAHCLKPFCSETLTHVTASLVTEEILLFSVFRYILLPASLLQRYFVTLSDHAVVSSGLASAYASYLLRFLPRAHNAIINPSALHSAMASQTALLKRASFMVALANHGAK